ncbi:unnamed protein product [Bursaphelenchus xylophilus]|uniref:(pine wood nematode) hypothetical protein n=1 Tax=Bursaphelenchus xylophilus TaxID=6326 RepID=A0A1I7S4D0_BURXY|nr:unnamed protein product [Bursaphelenchus xylophilus]CAG9116968.1 unnamed protein product [Bursaphelenchus xylophilus]
MRPSSSSDAMELMDRFSQLKEAIRITDQVWCMNILASGFPIDFVDEMGATALHYAAKSGSIRMVNILLNQGAQPDIADCLGFTPFLISARYGYLDIVKRLSQSGANPEKETALGMKSQCLADLAGHPHVVAALHTNTLEAAKDLKTARERFTGIHEDSLIFVKTSPAKRRSILGILKPLRLKRRRD